MGGPFHNARWHVIFATSLHSKYGNDIEEDSSHPAQNHCETKITIYYCGMWAGTITLAKGKFLLMMDIE